MGQELPLLRSAYVERKNGRDKNTKRALKATSTLVVRDELEELRVMRRNNQLAPTVKVPRFYSYCDDYMFHHQQILKKKPSSLRSEKRAHKTLEKTPW